MSAPSFEAIDQALRALPDPAGAVPSRHPRPRPIGRQRRRRWGWRLLGGVLLTVLPFLLLVRLSVAGYVHAGLGAWPSLGWGALGATLLLWGYVFAVSRRRRWLRRRGRTLRRVVLALVLAYTGYGALYLSAAHFKHADERATYTALHPVLRLALSTLTLLDADLVVTDTERVREDYARMGLPVFETSRHFRQADGYAHAVDLRTNGRAALKNAVMQGYFDLMGFRTLRHVGTADHLHVAMPHRAASR